MDIKFFHPEWAILGLAVATAVLIAAAALRRGRARQASIRAANTERFRAQPAYRRLRRQSVLCRTALVVGLAVSLAACLYLVARPYRREAVKEEVTRKDIFLCMDLSASSSSGVAGFVDQFTRMVPELEGDQIGISLFNTSSVQYVPLTEDSDFVLQRLEELATYFRAAEEFRTNYTDLYTYAHEIPESKRGRYEELNLALSAFDRGVTAGYEKKGTSVIGEGLVSCLFSFPELFTEQRPRIILFVTDNRPECIGDPLTTLTEAAGMCASDGVTVYGVYTASGTEGTEDTEKARAELKSAVESTGGTLFDLRDADSAAKILQEILNRERTTSKSAVYTRDTDMPRPAVWVLFGGLGLILASLTLLLAKTGRTMLKTWALRRKFLSAAVFAAAVACAVLIAVRPMVPDDDAEIRTENLDVCFAVDTTISMWAEDGPDGEKRMDNVKADITRIIEALPGSSFSLVSFDNGAQILAPYIQNFTALQDCAETIGLPSYATAEGSSLNVVHDTLAAMIRASDAKEGDRRMILFLMSDGEITDGSELMSFTDLRDGIDDGAVLGYGTSEGGRMYYPGKGYLRNPTGGGDAVSVLDEGNLKALAGDLGLNFVHQTDEGSRPLSRILTRVRRLSRETAFRNGDTTGWLETYHVFAGILALILLGCLYRLIRRGSVL